MLAVLSAALKLNRKLTSDKGFLDSLIQEVAVDELDFLYNVGTGGFSDKDSLAESAATTKQIGDVSVKVERKVQSFNLSFEINLADPLALFSVYEANKANFLPYTIERDYSPSSYTITVGAFRVNIGEDSKLSKDYITSELADVIAKSVNEILRERKTPVSLAFSHFDVNGQTVSAIYEPSEELTKVVSQIIFVVCKRVQRFIQDGVIITPEIQLDQDASICTSWPPKREMFFRSGYARRCSAKYSCAEEIL